MATTVMLSKETRDQLNRVKEAYGSPSVDAAVRRLLAEATPDAQTLYKRNKRKVDAVCQKYGLETLIAFGSRVRDDRTPASDLDLVTDFPIGTSLLDVVRIKRSLTTAFGVPVDIGSIPRPEGRLSKHIAEDGVILVGQID